MANIRNGVPPGWTWRDGRPRWVPSPTLRKAGWKGRDLRDGRGVWLARGPSVEAAQQICEAVAGWRAGAAVPETLRPCAPPGACDGPAPAEGALDAFSIGALIDAYLASDELRFRKNGQPRPPATIADYRNKLKRLVDALAGFHERARIAAEPAAYARAVARVRAMLVFNLEPVEAAGGLEDPLYDAYHNLRKSAGLAMAFGVMACASAWLAWAHKRKSRKIANWAADVARETPPGRIRVWSWAELAAMVAAAEKAGRPEITDAMVLALDLAWGEVDILALTWDRVVMEGGRWRALTGAAGRIKTGRVGGTPFLSMGVRRLEAIRARQKAMPAQPLKVIHLARARVHARRKAAADSDYFRKAFAEIRATAALKLPSCAGLTFADLRDTGFTLTRRAGLTDDGTASRTLHSRANVKAHADRSYGEIGPEIADPAADRLDAHVEAELRKHKVAL